jgi:peroxiredoxin
MSVRFVSSTVACVIMILAATTGFSGEKLSVGDKAPDFSLPYATKDTLVDALKLSDVVGKNNIILAFYPADWSGGCTKEMCTMRDNFGTLSDLGATVYGISGDYIYSHREWAKHHNLQFALLSDHDHSIAKTYSSYNATAGMNLRTVYVIDRSGTIAYVDLAYKSGTADSFEKLKAALAKLR